MTILAGVIFSFAIVAGQQTSSEVLEKLEQVKPVPQQPGKGVTKGALRLFGEKNDLTTVIVLVPKGAEVEIMATDEDYLLVRYEEYTGYLMADKVQFTAAADSVQNQAVQQRVAQQQEIKQQVSEKSEEQQVIQRQTGQEYRMNPGNRMTYLEHKYGKEIAVRIFAGKIWKGMTTGMVKDAWGEPDRTNRVVVNSVVKEEWIYRSTWLLMERGVLTEWGPVGR